MKELQAKGDMTEYPDADMLDNPSEQLQYVVPTLQEFFKMLINREAVTPIAAIGQALTQMCMQRSILMPIMWAFGVTAHHEHRSRGLMMLWNAFCFSSS